MTTDAKPTMFALQPLHAGHLGSGVRRRECIFSRDSHQVAEIVGRGGRAIADARLLAAATSSYTKHFADPVAAAEADLLGQALEALAAIYDVLHPGVLGLIGNRHGKPQLDAAVAAHATARAVLSQTKEPA